MQYKHFLKKKNSMSATPLYFLSIIAKEYTGLFANKEITVYRTSVKMPFSFLLYIWFVEI